MQPYYAPDFDVKIEGLTMAADVRNAVIDLTYDNNLDTADMFTLRLNNADLRFTDSPLINVGKTVEIYMGYVGELEPMMLGEITAISPTFPQGGAPTISITGYDKSHRMRHNRPGRFTFKYVNDSFIAAQIAAENLLIPVVDPAPMPPRESVQQTGSDWAFLKELAERNFFQVYVYWDKLYFRFPRPQTERVTLEWGKNLSSFTPRLSTSAQVGIQIIRGYDYKLCQEIVAIIPAVALGSDLDDIVERLGSSFIDQLVKLGRNVIRDQPVDSYVDATILAKSILKQILDGLYEGSGSCIGLPKLRAGNTVKIEGLGKRFSGNYTLSKVTHTINEGGYQTRFEVTQKSTSTLLQSLRKKIAESSSPNRQERNNNVVVGVVEDNSDLEGLGRVQVSFPHLSDSNRSAWARIATPMAGSGMGMYFLPEVGDEVLVEFEHGDINRPLILGSVWNGCGRPPEDNLDGQNHIRTIRSRAGHTIRFDDTSGNEEVVIEHNTGSQIRLQSDGTISIEANADLELNAGGNISLNATGGDINLDTQNVNVSVTGVMDVS
ncbi:MAG: phage baseplate assembly protein V [Crocosphaera sp.]|nr:phage baseplate assembly protein V [Crocosphaera sp.]